MICLWSEFMEFEGFNSVDLSPAGGSGFVYVLCCVYGGKEVPFYVGQTQSIWGRLNDYHWADFQASTDFRVGEAVRYLRSQSIPVIAKYKFSEGREAEEARTILQLRSEGAKLLNVRPGYNYRTAQPESERIKVQDDIDSILGSLADKQVSDEQRATIARLSNEGLRAPAIGERLGLPTQVVAGIIAWQKHRDSWQR